MLGEQQKDAIEAEVFLATRENPKNFRSGVKKDLFNILFLIYLYILQGVPLGLAVRNLLYPFLNVPYKFDIF